MSQDAEKSCVQDFIPFLDWLPHYKGEWLRFDLTLPYRCGRCSFPKALLTHPLPVCRLSSACTPRLVR
jgi:hypothetical protein